MVIECSVNLREKTLAIGHQFVKFTNVFLRQCFPLYSICVIITYTYVPSLCGFIYMYMYMHTVNNKSLVGENFHGFHGFSTNRKSFPY